jgi:hypothetical protein
VRRRLRSHWDAFAPYWAFNHILYGRSPRYRPSPNAKTWRCKGTYKPGDPEPPTSVREESFPKLWTDKPEGLLHLAAESRCRPVHSFLAKALRACPEFLQKLDLDVLIMLIGQPYEATAQLGCELGERRYNAFAPDDALVKAMASSVSAPGRAAALRFIDENRSHFLLNSELVLSLCLSKFADARSFALRLLRAAELPEPVTAPLIARMVAHLMSLSAADEAEARDVAAILQESLGSALRRVSLHVLLDLLRHPLCPVQELSAELILSHETAPKNLPLADLTALLRALLDSQFESVRALGMRILGQASETTLRGQPELFLALCTHTRADLRSAARPIVQRLVHGHPELAARLVALFVESLCHKEPAEGAHAHLLRILREDLSATIFELPLATAMQLATTKSKFAQELAGVILSASPQHADHLAMRDIVKLGGAEVKTLRDACFALFTHALPRMKADPGELAQAVRLLECKWDDARDFAMRTLGSELDERHYTPEILVGICDSVVPEV